MKKELLFMLLEEEEKEKEEIQIVPMIDVMLFLLVFFMIYTINVIPSLVQNLNIPASSTVQPMEKKEPIRIYITKTGEIYYERDKVNLEEVAQRLKNLPNKEKQSVLVIPDKEVKMQEVMDVIDVVKEAGIEKLGIAGEKR